MADNSFRLFYALCNTKPDGSPALPWKWDKAEPLLKLGDHGTLFRINGIYTTEPGSDVKNYFAPQDPAVWKKGQMNGAVMRLLADAAESGAWSATFTKSPAPKAAAPKADHKA